MATETIDFNKTIAYSKLHCVAKSLSKCATYVKKAFEAGGCKYISGNGWNNQKFCKENGFQLIGDFEPIDHNPRAHNGMAMQFPENYTQQTGDICLIKHGTYGHICYATGPGINDWVSDYRQHQPGQQDNTGPYCYTGGVTRVQFWRHSSVMGSTPSVTETPTSEIVYDTNSTPTSYSSSSSSSQSLGSVDAQEISSSNNTVSSSNYNPLLGTHMKQRK